MGWNLLTLLGVFLQLLCAIASSPPDDGVACRQHVIPVGLAPGIKVPVLTILGGNDATSCGPSSQGGNFDCSSGAIVATQEAPFYSPEARIHACVVPASGHDLSLAANHGLPTAEAVAWSIAFVGQLDIGETRRPYGSNENEQGLPWNDALPWNCGAVSASSR